MSGRKLPASSSPSMSPFSSNSLSLPQIVNSTLYYLLSQYRADWHYTTAPGGLATDGYFGNACWDAETWQSPIFQPFWPGIAAAQSFYRFNRQAAARAYAAQNKYQGLMFPWMTAGSGGESNLAEPFNLLEQHINGDIAVFLINQWDVTKNMTWLKQVGYPLLEGLADFWASRVDWEGGVAHISHVVGPDEYGIGPLYEGVRDSIYTNAAAIAALDNANRARVALGFTENAQWANVSAHIPLLFDPVSQTHPEYAGFPSGNRLNGGKVKQADVIMITYPLNVQVPVAVRRNDLNRYSALYDAKGPAMTSAMEIIGWCQLHNATATATKLTSLLQHTQQPFGVWTESTEPNQHASFTDLGCYNFMTGAAGFVQALTNGFGGLRIRKDRLQLSFFPLSLGAETVHFNYRGLVYQGRKFSASWDGEVASVCRSTVGGGSPKLPVDVSTLFANGQPVPVGPDCVTLKTPSINITTVL